MAPLSDQSLRDLATTGVVAAAHGIHRLHAEMAFAVGRRVRTQPMLYAQLLATFLLSTVAGAVVAAQEVRADLAGMRRAAHFRRQEQRATAA